MDRARRILLRRLHLTLGLFLAASAPGAADRVHMFWMVEGKEGARVYLLGSLHFGTADMYPLPPPIVDACREADTMLFETDMAAVSNPSAALRLMTLGTYPQDESLSDHADEKTLAALRKILKKMNLPESQFLRYRPWYAAMILGVMGMQRAGLSPLLGVDVRLHKWGTENRKTIDWFESFDFQLKLFSDLGEKAGLTMLGESIEEVEQLPDLGPMLTRLWKTGDDKGIVELVNDGLESSPELKKKLLIDRNKAWLGKLRECLKGKKRSFVVVGSGHLGGPEGLVELLRKEGYKVTRPVMPPPPPPEPKRETNAPENGE